MPIQLPKKSAISFNKLCLRFHFVNSELKATLNKSFLFSLFILFTFHETKGQTVFLNNSGFTAGVSITSGTQINSLGFFLKTFALVKNNFQVNSELRVNYYFKYLGPILSFPECQFSIAVVGSFGSPTEKVSSFLGRLNNRTGFKNAIVYSYNFYFNRIGTLQQTGTVAIESGNFYLAHENDLLARPRLDRFRTAALQLGYEEGVRRISITQSNWTGQMGAAIRDTAYPSVAKGYLDTTGGRFTKFSHGLLYASIELTETKNYRQLKLSAGVDSERIRHAIQNRLIHDACIFPNALRNKNNYHIPMLQENGNPFLFKRGEKIKTPREYFSFSMNSDYMY